MLSIPFSTLTWMSFCSRPGRSARSTISSFLSTMSTAGDHPRPSPPKRGIQSSNIRLTMSSNARIGSLPRRAMPNGRHLSIAMLCPSFGRDSSRSVDDDAARQRGASNRYASDSLFTVELLWQEIGDADARGRRRERCDDGVGGERLDGGIAPASPRRTGPRRLAIDLQNAIDQVDDPVVRDPASGVARGFPSPGDGQTRERDLDDQRRVRRMSIDIVTQRATDDTDVGLRLGPEVEADRALDLNEPTIAERALERLRNEPHRGAVRARLRLLDEQQTIEQLDRVVLVEDAAIDQPRVLTPGPAIERRPRGVLHERMLVATSHSINVAAPIPSRRAPVERRRRRADPPAASTPAAVARRHATPARPAAPGRGPPR